MKLDKHSNVPLYAQLHELMLKRIKDGNYAAGGKIPSEMELCKELDLSRPTVRQAIAALVDEGYLEIRKGRGTFVVERPERVNIRHFQALTFSFLSLNSLEEIELEPIKLQEAEAKLDEKFGITDKKHPGYWHFRWPLHFNEKTIGFCQSFVPVQQFPELGQDIASQKRMIDIKSNKYAYLPVKGSIRITSEIASVEEAKMLDVPQRSAILKAEGQIFAKNGNPCEYISVIFRADLVSLEIN